MSIKLWKRYVVLVILGCLLGGATVLFIYAKKMEDMMLVKESLELLNKKLIAENEYLQESLKQSQRISRKKQDVVIEEIRVTVLDPKPKLPTIEMQVADKLEKDLSSLKGKKIEQVAEVHQILLEMLRRREYVVDPDNTLVEVRIKTVVISQRLRLFVTAEIKKEDVLKKVARNFLFIDPYILNRSPEIDSYGQGPTQWRE